MQGEEKEKKRSLNGVELVVFMTLAPIAFHIFLDPKAVAKLAG